MRSPSLRQVVCVEFHALRHRVTTHRCLFSATSHPILWQFRVKHFESAKSLIEQAKVSGSWNQCDPWHLESSRENCVPRFPEQAAKKRNFGTTLGAICGCGFYRATRMKSSLCFVKPAGSLLSLLTSGELQAPNSDSEYPHFSRVPRLPSGALNAFWYL